jgi:hypothetical protein
MTSRPPFAEQERDLVPTSPAAVGSQRTPFILAIPVLLLALVMTVAICAGCVQVQGTRDALSASVSTSGDDAVASAFKQQRSGVQVTGEGIVTKVLPDDNEGSRHQRFILRLASGQTLLVAHNIDLAPRVAPLELGDSVGFNGEYEWNSEGGVIHWTHRDPNGQHQAGWLKHDGRTYQ